MKFSSSCVPGGGGRGEGEKAGIFLWSHSSAGKRGGSYVNQAVAKNDVNQSFVFVFNWSFFNSYHYTCTMRICTDFSPPYAFSGGYRTYSWHWEIPISAATNIKRKIRPSRVFFLNKLNKIEIWSRALVYPNSYYWWRDGDIYYAYSFLFTGNRQ